MNPLLQRAQPWLGTKLELCIAEAEPSADCNAAMAAAFAVVAHIHNSMSPQVAASDIARFNTAAAGEQIACAPATLQVLRAARELAEASDGAFDISLGSGGLDAYSLTDTAVRKRCTATRLDLGGIAKGYAVDAAVEALQAAGVKAGWVNAGGDLRVFGALDLPVHIRSLTNASHSLPLVALRDGALATSVLPLADGSTAHISVAAPQCLWADALTKVVAYAPTVSDALLARYHSQAWRHAPF